MKTMNLKERGYIMLINVTFRYDPNGKNPALFKIENGTHFPVDKATPEGKVVFLHKEYKDLFEEEKEYLCVGKATWREGKGFEFFIPEKIYVRGEGHPKEIKIPEELKKKYIFSEELK